MKTRSWLLALLLPFGARAAEPVYYPFAVDEDRLSGAPDFSFLNHPIEAPDHIEIRDGHFYREGPDAASGTAGGGRVRFFAVNLAFGANFPEESDAPRIAARLRRLGVNLVRLHHMDSRPDKDPDNAGSALTTGPYPTLNPVAIRRLRRFLDALKADGIYVDMNLHVGYVFRPEVDGVPTDGVGPMPTQGKPLQIFYPRMIALQQEYARRMIAALDLRDDPVLAMVEINNEDSLIEAWMFGKMERNVRGAYRDELQKQWNAYLGRTDVPLVGPKDTDNPHYRDFALFLVNRDAAYLDSIKRVVREAVGWPVSVTGTQMRWGEFLTLDAEAGMDYQDDHFYVDSYTFPPGPWNRYDWRIRNADTSKSGTNLTAYINAAISRVQGRPFTISEYNQAWPDQQGFRIDPSTAAFAAFQDWDALMHFDYSEVHDSHARAPNGLSLSGDWPKYVNFGQAAWIFRTGAVRTGTDPISIPVTQEMQVRFAKGQRPDKILPLLKSMGVDPYFALVHPASMARQEGASLPAIPPVRPPYVTDTGELTFDPSARQLTVIRSPEAAGVFGFIGTEKTSAGAIDVQLAPGGRGFSAILVTSLDGRPLGESTRLLVTDPGCAFGTVAGSQPPRMQALAPYPGMEGWWTLPHTPDNKIGPSGFLDSGVPPSYMEKISAVVTLRSSARSLTVYPLDAAGRREAGSEAASVPGGFALRLDAETPWYEVTGGR